MVKLLIVDDDLPTCDFLRNFFEKKEYQIFTASDGEKALTIVRAKQPNIALLDIKMPGISGMQVLQKIKEIDKKISVIMMTAVTDEAMVELAREYGASDYITKPFSLERLEKDVIPKILRQII